MRDLLNMVRYFSYLVICFDEQRKKFLLLISVKIKMIGGMRNKAIQKCLLSQ